MDIKWKEKVSGLSLEHQWNELYNIKKQQGHPALWAAGNAVQNAKNIIQEMPRIFKKYRIKTMFDIGCGNVAWMREANFTGVQYTGGDIVNDLVEENKMNFPDLAFMHFNIVEQIPKRYDLLFLRSVFIHLEIKDVLAAIRNIKQSGSKYIILNSHIGVEDNKETSCLMLKKRDFMKPPFGLPKPLYSFDENGHGVCQICLWRVKDL